MFLPTLISRAFSAYELLVIVWCIMSWIPHGNSTVEGIRSTIGVLVEPYLGLFRRLIPPFGGIDFSPIVALFALGLIERLVFSIL